MATTNNLPGYRISRVSNGRWPTFSKLTCAIVALFVTTFLAAGVQAAVIFSNFDSDGNFSGQDNSVAAEAFALSIFVEGATRAAAQFTVTGGNFTLSSITLPISFQGTGPNNTLRVRLTADSVGAPGANLEVLSENQIWPDFLKPFTTTKTLTSVANPLLADGGKYWIVTELTSFVDDGEFVDYRWYHNTSLTTVPFRYQQRLDGQLPEDPWPSTPYTANYVAFRVEGTLVPIPPTLLLLSAGLTGLAFYRPRKF